MKNNLKILIQEASKYLYGLPKKKEVDNHAKIARMYLNMTPEERKRMLDHDLQQWPEEARIEFGKVAQNFKQYGLEPQHAMDIWNAATGGVKFNTPSDRREYLTTLNKNLARSSAKKFEPIPLERRAFLKKYPLV